MAAFLFVDELGLDLLQAGHAGDIDELLHELAGNAFLAVLGQNALADTADVAFPAAVILEEGGDGDDLAFVQGQQR